MTFFRKLTMPGGLMMITQFAATTQAEELSHYSGAQFYERFCAACHGERAEGDDPVIAPPDLARLAKRRGGDFPTEDVSRIIDGRNIRSSNCARTMPVWGMELRFAATGNPEKQKPVEELIDRLMGYLRSIQK